ncbi:MAG: hypothetical protein DLM52_02630 [Chthoniobacterales bacterium]|nr:MAG: hypothetical protein DLM52_02630 [Chthoniobacterales bacterium]
MRITSLEIVLVDQMPLRVAIASECTAAMGRLERARIGWHQFERQDKPAFIRWRAREFGALLSTARDIEEKIREAQTLVHEVEMEMRRHFQDPQSAYRRVMFRRKVRAGRANGDDAADDERDVHSGRTRKLSDFEKEALFQEWVQKVLGTNPDKMDDEAYSTTFEVFKSRMFVSASKEPGPPPPQRPAAAARPVSVDEGADAQAETPPVDPRVKELYRRLVRRLHPDSRGHSADGSATVSALWHEVQEAYAAGDVARMELLLALSDLSDHLGAGTTLWQMHSTLAQLNRSVSALEKSLAEAEGEDAWNFSRTGPSDELRLRVERQLKHQLAAREQRLDLLSRTIGEWASGPMANPKLRPIQFA